MEQLHQFGLVDLHYDTGSHLYEHRDGTGVLARDLEKDYINRGVGVIGAAV